MTQFNNKTRKLILDFCSGIAISLVVILLILVACAPAYPGVISGKITRVIDGDTIVISAGNNRIGTIRLYGIDSPELNQPFGRDARGFLEMHTGKIVTLKDTGPDRYNRIIGEVFCDGRSLNRELVRHGMAWWYNRYAEDDADLAELHAKARESRVGLWGAGKAPIPPWEWRKGKRE